jgi:transcriptional regulator with XRE-family HTH domain
LRIISIDETFRKRIKVLILNGATEMGALRRIRQEVFGLTLTEMAAIAGVAQSTISKWENGIHRLDFQAMARIRSAALERHLAWDDAWLFDTAPSHHAPTVDAA